MTITIDTPRGTEDIEPGCYIDGHWGQYGPDRVIEIANDYVGANIDNPRDDDDDTGESSEALSWAADEAEEKLNEVTAGGYWSWEDGEFFLTEIHETDWETGGLDRPLKDIGPIYAYVMGGGLGAPNGVEDGQPFANLADTLSEHAECYAGRGFTGVGREFSGATPCMGPDLRTYCYLVDKLGDTETPDTYPHYLIEGLDLEGWQEFERDSEGDPVWIVSQP